MRKWKVKDLAAIAFFSLSFFLPAVLFAVYAIASPNFIPTNKLNWVSIYIGPVLGIAYFCLLLIKGKRKILKIFSTNSIGGMKMIGLLVFMPMFIYFIWHCFAVMPLPYSLHILSKPSPATIVEEVTRTTYGRVGCRNMAKLQGDTFWFHREVCNLQPEDTEIFVNGGSILLRGASSKYGFQYTGYGVTRDAR